MSSDDLTAWDDPKWTVAWAEYADAEKRFTTLVQALASSMRLPKRQLRRRMVGRSKSWLKAHLGKGRRPSPAVTTGDKPDASPTPPSNSSQTKAGGNTSSVGLPIP